MFSRFLYLPCSRSLPPFPFFFTKYFPKKGIFILVDDQGRFVASNISKRKFHSFPPHNFWVMPKIVNMSWVFSDVQAVKGVVRSSDNSSTANFRPFGDRHTLRRISNKYWLIIKMVAMVTKTLDGRDGGRLSLSVGDYEIYRWLFLFQISKRPWIVQVNLEAVI